MNFACPSCNADVTKVIDSRRNEGGISIRRRRKCSCGHRFSTYEMTMADYAELVAFREAAEVERQRRIAEFAASLPPTPRGPTLGLRPRLTLD